MKERTKQIAEKFHILEKCNKLESDLLQIDGVTDVDFDLSGFYDNLHEVIILAKYRVHQVDGKYYEPRRIMLDKIIVAANQNGLLRTQDKIEDYGEHFYLVFECSEEWATESSKSNKESSSEYVKTNMGMMPREDYLETMAYQYGFDSYEDMCKNGYTI